MPKSSVFLNGSLHKLCVFREKIIGTGSIVTIVLETEKVYNIQLFQMFHTQNI